MQCFLALPSRLLARHNRLAFPLFLVKCSICTFPVFYFHSFSGGTNSLRSCSAFVLFSTRTATFVQLRLLLYSSRLPVQHTRLSFPLFCALLLLHSSQFLFSFFEWWVIQFVVVTVRFNALFLSPFSLERPLFNFLSLLLSSVFLLLSSYLLFSFSTAVHSVLFRCYVPICVLQSASCPMLCCSSVLHLGTRNAVVVVVFFLLALWLAHRLSLWQRRVLNP